MNNLIDLYNLKNTEFFVKNIEAHYHYWSPNSQWKTYEYGRKNHAFMYFLSCKNTYFINKTKVLTANQGDVVYLPIGSCYECKFEQSSIDRSLHIQNDINNYYYNGKLRNKNTGGDIYNAIYVGFDLYDSDFNEAKFADGITLLPSLDAKTILSRFNNILSYSQRGRPSALLITTAFYNLLIDISDSFQLRKTHIKNDSLLNPAFQYIAKNNLSDITVSQLANECRLSPSGFRSLFKKQTGVSPIDYLLDLKLKKAKILLADNNLSIAQVAYTLGFSDLSYFSKFYKQHTGKSPSDDRNI